MMKAKVCFVTFEQTLQIRVIVPEETDIGVVETIAEKLLENMGSCDWLSGCEWDKTSVVSAARKVVLTEEDRAYTKNAYGTPILSETSLLNDEELVTVNEEQNDFVCVEDTDWWKLDADRESD